MSKASNNPFPSILIVEGTVPTSPSAGDQRLYIDSTDHVVKRVDSTGTVSPVGAMQKVAETILSVAAASITFSSIPQTYRSLQLRLDGRGDTAATFANLQFRLNGDTGANYDQQSQSANGSTVSSSAVFAQTQGTSGWIAAATAPAGVSSAALIDINNYSGATFNKEAICQGSLKQGTSTGNLFLVAGRVFWRNSAAITSLSIFPDAGNFAAGTTATLYGIS